MGLFMREYDIYIPMIQNDGSASDPAAINGIKEELAEAFGGYTYFRQRNEGVWNFGGVTFRDEVTILRVLGNGRSNFDMASFKQKTEAILRQKTILIVARDVSVIE